MQIYIYIYIYISIDDTPTHKQFTTIGLFVHVS